MCVRQSDSAPLCPRGLLFRPGHFDVNGCSDECVAFFFFYKKPYCARRGWGWNRQCFALIYMCTDTHKNPWTIEPLDNTIAACWVEFSHRNMLVKFFESASGAQAWESCERICWICFILLTQLNLPPLCSISISFYLFLFFLYVTPVLLWVLVYTH